MGYPMYKFPLKIFVKGENAREDTKVNEVENTEKSLTGDSARDFYESVIKGSSTAEPERTRDCKKNKSRSVSRGHTLKKFSTRDVWKLAQNNDYIALESLLRDNKNMNVDCKDPFGWTPIMCASCSGAKESVEILIRNKADPNISDKSGNTALTLAKRNSFFHIADILQNENNYIAKDNKNKIKSKKIEKIYCKTCNSDFHTDIKNHECSTLHLFNGNTGQTRTFYGIPESNKGFQMLLKNGWDREKGLGLNECGIRFPIKAHKKSDRVGFGGAPSKTKACSNNLKKEQRCKTGKSWKNFERNFRLEFL